jgi:hypothetical protein
MPTTFSGGALAALFLLLVPCSALGTERDLSMSICYNYQVDPPPRGPSNAPSVAKCRVIGQTMYIDGGIFPDEYLFELTAHYPDITLLQLNSDGGAMDNLYKLTDLIRARGIQTHVRKGATCSSACTMLYIAGTRRTAHPEARFMIHAIHNGGKPIDLAKLCEKEGPQVCGKTLIEIVDDQRASTREMFQKYVEYGASSTLMRDYLKLPKDELWYEHGNFTQRIDWVMNPEEAQAQGFVQVITERP